MCATNFTRNAARWERLRELRANAVRLRDVAINALADASNASQDYLHLLTIYEEGSGTASGSAVAAEPEAAAAPAPAR